MVVWITYIIFETSENEIYNTQKTNTMITQTRKMTNILNEICYLSIDVSAIENTTGDFFVIYYRGGVGVKTSNAISRALDSIDGLSICKGEAGYSVAKGNYITVNY